MRKKKYNAGRWEVTRERFALGAKRPPVARRDAVALGAILGGLAKRIEGTRCDWVARLARDWVSVVGEDIAAHTRPGRLDGQWLIVFVDSSVWLYELNRLGTARVLKNIQQYVGSQKIKRVTLHPDPGDESRARKS